MKPFNPKNCVNCGTELLDAFDRSPNGDPNCVCAKCRAEESHDFDQEPGVVYNRAGNRIEGFTGRATTGCEKADLCRKEFEKEYGLINDLTRKPHPDFPEGVYGDWNLQLTWNCWQKSWQTCLEQRGGRDECVERSGDH